MSTGIRRAVVFTLLKIAIAVGIIINLPGDIIFISTDVGNVAGIVVVIPCRPVCPFRIVTPICQAIFKLLNCGNLLFDWFVGVVKFRRRWWFSETCPYRPALICCVFFADIRLICSVGVINIGLAVFVTRGKDVGDSFAGKFAVFISVVLDMSVDVMSGAIKAVIRVTEFS